MCRHKKNKGANSDQADQGTELFSSPDPFGQKSSNHEAFSMKAAGALRKIKKLVWKTPTIWGFPKIGQGTLI